MIFQAKDKETARKVATRKAAKKWPDQGYEVEVVKLAKVEPYYEITLRKKRQPED